MELKTPGWHIFKTNMDENYLIASASNGSYVVCDITDKKNPKQLHY